MTKAEWVSLAMMVAGPVLALGTAVLLRPRQRVVLAGAVSGLFVAVANSVIEVAAAAFDVYRVDGLFPVWGTPLSRTLGWSGLGLAFCLQYDHVVGRASRPWLARSVVAGLALGLGLCFDSLGAGPLAFLSLGGSGRPYHIVLVWVVLLPATLLVFERQRPAQPAA